LVNATSGAIFWGTSWRAYTGDKITGMDSWYVGFNNSNYAVTSDEYTGSNGQVGPGTSYVGHQIDGSAAPTRAPSTSTVLAEVCKVVSNPASDGTGYYMVYSDQRRSKAGYLARHSYRRCSGGPGRLAFPFNLHSAP